jgi:predicted RND superfamily exporter protein
MENFDPASGSRIERLVFNHRLWVMLGCLLVTLFLGWQATRVQLNASFEGMLPLGHPYLQNYLAERKKLVSQANSVRIIVERKNGESILDPTYLETLRHINDDVFLLPGVARGQMKSLWTPSTRWTAVTERGFEGGPVIPDDYDGTPAKLARVRLNIERSGEVGQLVAMDFHSSALIVPLTGRDPDTGRELDYGALSQQLEKLRAKYADAGVNIHITGFAKVVGDLIEGMAQVMAFFGLAAAICAVIVFWYTRCVRSTALVMLCSIVAVVWQLGLLPLLGYSLDPYAVLVPFLVFAIGMSHGAQKMNGIMQDIGRGMPRLVAARFTFRRLFAAGLTALLCDAVGFGVLLIIDIDAIRRLAVIASLGVAILVFTNLILLPVLLSYAGVTPSAAERSLRAENAPAGKRDLWSFLSNSPKPAGRPARLVAAAVLAGVGLYTSRHAASGRPGRRCARAARQLALQPGQRLPDAALRHQQRRDDGDGENKGPGRDDACGAGPGRCARMAAAPGAGRRDHAVAGLAGAPDGSGHERRQSALVRAAAQPGRAQYRRLARAARPGRRRFFAAAGAGLPGRPPG